MIHVLAYGVVAVVASSLFVRQMVGFHHFREYYNKLEKKNENTLMWIFYTMIIGMSLAFLGFLAVGLSFEKPSDQPTEDQQFKKQYNVKTADTPAVGDYKDLQDGRLLFKTRSGLLLVKGTVEGKE